METTEKALLLVRQPDPCRDVSLHFTTQEAMDAREIGVGFSGVEAAVSSSSSWSLGSSLYSLQCWPWAAQGRGVLAERLPELVPTLLDCAAHVEEGSIEKASFCLARVTRLAARAQGPVRRLAVTMNGFLARRLLRPIPAIADAIMDSSGCPDRRSVREARRGFFDITPFPKVAAVLGNRAILEAMENERNVHVIALSGVASQPHQWVQLLRDFRRRPEGPPHLRLTVVLDDKDLLADMSELLSDEAGELDMAFQFHGVVAQIETLDFDDLHDALQIKSGEARAICCTLQLHRLLAVDDAAYNLGAAYFNQMASIARLQQMAATISWPPSVSTEYDGDDHYRSPATPLSFVSPPASTPHFQMPPPLVSFLTAVRALSPKIVVLAEQEANHNGVSFRKRFAEALHYYAALYDILEAGAAAHRRSDDERAQVERVVLREELRDVLLHEGVHRRERHDGLLQWALRMKLAGFHSVPLSYIAIKQGNDVLRACGWRHCKNQELHGCLLLCWSSRPLYSVSAWRPSRWSEATTSASSVSEYMSALSQVVSPVQGFDGVMADSAE